MKSKTIGINSDDEVILVELEAAEDAGYGFCIAMDKFYHENALMIVADKPLSPIEFLHAIKEFIVDVETDQIDLEMIFNLNKSSRTAH
jgi:hypothetical protein